MGSCVIETGETCESLTSNPGVLEDIRLPSAPVLTRKTDFSPFAIPST